MRRIADFASLYQVRTGSHGPSDLSPVCMAAAWDSEKVDLLPAWNPDVQKLITAQKTLSAAEPGSFKS